MNNIDDISSKVEEALQRLEQRVKEIEGSIDEKVGQIPEMIDRAVGTRSAPIRDVGGVVTRKFDIADFTGVEISHAFRFEIVKSDSYSVEISANEKIFDHINALKSGDTLKIGMKPHLGIRGNITLEAKITMPILKSLSLSGASRGTAKGFSSAEDFKLHLSGASVLEMSIEASKAKIEMTGASKLNGEMKLGDTDIGISGASRLDLKGSANNVVLNASGASRMELGEFTVNDADIHASGASTIVTNTNGNLKIELSGASKFEYAGNPSIHDIRVSGASKIRHK